MVLGEIAGGARAERAHRVLVLGVHAQHQHRHARMLGPQALEHLEEAGARHRHVEQDHVGGKSRGSDASSSSPFTASPTTVEAGMVGDDAAKSLAHHRVVVGDQQPDHGIHPGSE